MSRCVSTSLHPSYLLYRPELLDGLAVVLHAVLELTLASDEPCLLMLHLPDHLLLQSRRGLARRHPSIELVESLGGPQPARSAQVEGRLAQALVPEPLPVLS